MYRVKKEQVNLYRALSMVNYRNIFHINIRTLAKLEIYSYLYFFGKNTTIREFLKQIKIDNQFNDIERAMLYKYLFENEREIKEHASTVVFEVVKDYSYSFDSAPTVSSWNNLTQRQKNQFV